MESRRLLDGETERVSEDAVTSFEDNHRRTKTTALLFNSFGIGLVAAVAGTTLIQTRLLYGVSTATMSIALTLESCGCVLGVITCGWLISRLKFEFITGICVAVAALMTVCAPFLPVFPAFVVAVIIRGFANGCSNLNSQFFCINAWDGHRKALVTQSQNAVWSVAATISPFIMKPFLVGIVPMNDLQNASTILPTNISTQSTTDSEFGMHYMNTTLVSHLDDVTSTHSFQESTISLYSTIISEVTTVTIDPPIEGLLEVRFAYLVVGLLSLMNAIPILIMYFYINGMVLPCRQPQQPHENVPDRLNYGTVQANELHNLSSTSRRPSCSAVFYVIIVFCIGILYGGLELTPRSFLTSFVDRRLSWTVHDATLLLSVFYAAFGSGRLLAVPLSTIVSPTALLVGNTLFIFTGLGILLLLDFVTHLSPAFVWIGSGLLGLGLSSTYACLVLVVSADVTEGDVVERQSLKLSTVLSAFSIGCNVGFVLFPVIVGHLFDYQSPMWMVYVLIGTAVCEAILLVTRAVLGRLL